ncbi:serine hydrolase [Streptomyces sp. NRRL WC-3626]|uniref:serine hydrolase n=1 Tax=Streptomyces sp. NRRL WC-3626 TaxID=1463926 RepID=UPI001F3CCE9B|nr:serine hydrolase [Streptomyces sp. NRRL WC-3626]
MEEASVAGESPDRSKQRESSAEPTSGSAGPVPGKRDPRLAVSREAAPDTATRVLSVREEPPSGGGNGESGRLREAVATWVRPADDETTDSPAAPGAPGAPADAGDASEGPADTEGTSGGSADTEGTSGGSADTGGTSGGSADTGGTSGDSADAQGTSGGSADTEGTSEGSADAQGTSGGSADTGNDSGGSADTGEREIGTVAGDVSGDRGTAEAASGAERASTAEAGSVAGASGEEGEGGSDPAGEDASGRAVAAAKSESAGDSPEGASRSEGEQENAGAGTGTGADDASGTEDGPETAAHDDASRAEGRRGSGAAQTAAPADTDAPTATAEDEPAARKTGADAPMAAADASGAEDEHGNVQADSDDTPDATASRADADSKSAAKGTAVRAGTGASAPEPAAGASRDEAAGETGTGADAAESATDASRDEGEREDATRPGASGAEDKRGGAASEGAAQADDSAKDASRADGEGGGGVPGARGSDDAGARPKGKGPVDQPTAVFRTGRAPAPAVDQPTTMLKLGDAARRADAEAERTSRFVALKRDEDLGARKPPAAPVQPTGPTTSLPQVGPERTTQQPLPPRPPLDLLAELTNTPPPPQTPLRTAVRRLKIWTPLVLLLVIVFGVVQNFRPLPTPTLELTAEDSFTFEGGKVDIPWPEKGQAALDVDGIGTFGSSGEQKPVPIASVAKVMTAYVILRDHDLKSGADGPKIKVDELAEKQSDAGDESTVNVTAGDEISQREALEAILIASANNVARLLARWDAGSEKAFVDKMNAAAKDLGMTNTTYTDPSGLNNTTVSTAVDQVKLAKAAMKQPAFREVAAMMEYIDYKGTKHGNWNRLVGHNDVVGIKTGTTTSALGNLSFAAKKDVDGETHRIIGAVVRQPEGGVDNTILSGALSAGDQLIRAAQDVLESATILKKGTVVGYADDGLGGRTPVAVTEDVKAVGWAGLSVKLTFTGGELPHTAKAGTKVGTLTVGDGTSGAVKVPVALQEDLVEPGFGDRLTRLT